MRFETINIAPEKKNVQLSAYILDRGEPVPQKRPAVIVLPGGAYISCSSKEGEPVAVRFASMGYHAFVLKYSTLFRGFFPEPDMSRANPGVKYPGPLEDVGRAILTIRENAERWDVDTDKIIICGFSAGGLLAAMYAVGWNRPELSGALGTRPEMLRPAAAVLSYAVTDLCVMRDVEADEETRQMYNLFNQAVFGKAEPSEDELTELSPVYQISSDTPPCFIWATAEDKLVPCENSLGMANALAKNKVPFECHIFESGPHALSLADEACAVTAADIEPDTAKWVSLAEAWLKKRFSPELTS